MVKWSADTNLWNEFHSYFIAFVVEDVKKSLQANIKVGTIILTTVGIECLCGYYAGQESDRKHFINFVQTFMPSYANYADDIYVCIRNGLAHDYVVKENRASEVTFVFQRNHGEPHLSPTPINPNVIYLNREDYANDFLEAQRQYFEKVEYDQSLWDNAMKRLKSQKGFLTVRPLHELVTPSTEESYPGKVARPSTTSLPTGTSTKPQGTVYMSRRSPELCFQTKRAPNKACTRLVEVCAISSNLRGCSWFRQNGVTPSHPPAGNAIRWAD